MAHPPCADPVHDGHRGPGSWLTPSGRGPGHPGRRDPGEQSVDHTPALGSRRMTRRERPGRRSDRAKLAVVGTDRVADGTDNHERLRRRYRAGDSCVASRRRREATSSRHRHGVDDHGAVERPTRTRWCRSRSTGRVGDRLLARSRAGLGRLIIGSTTPRSPQTITPRNVRRPPLLTFTRHLTYEPVAARGRVLTPSRVVRSSSDYAGAWCAHVVWSSSLRMMPPAGAKSYEQRCVEGRSLRKEVPRSGHARWEPDPRRPDPVARLEASNVTRVPDLVPVRYERMLVSPFAFLRGAAQLMADDLASTPVTGYRVQACGDAHLANFGVFATPERNLVFDVNDFDETLPRPPGPRAAVHRLGGPSPRSSWCMAAGPTPRAGTGWPGGCRTTGTR